MNVRKSIATLGVVFCFAGTEVALAQTATVCDAYAQNYARDASRKGQVFGGTVGGAVIGAGLVAITGGVAAAGAAIGGGIGALGGGRKRRESAERTYQAAFDDCMAGRVK
jgi:predicted lipid-binding transport protein (Tim44 family)